LRQRHWLELLKDYTLEIKYHPGKANVVADALSRKPKGMVASILTTNPHLLKELKSLQVEIISSSEQIQLGALQVASFIVDEIKKHQQDDSELVKLIKKIKEGSTKDFFIKDGVLWFRNHLCVPNDSALKKELLKESHDSALTTHLGSTKMYQDLKPYYWWSRMKKDVANYVACCLTYQRVKTEHHRLGGLLQPLPILVWKWDHIKKNGLCRRNAANTEAP